MAYSEKIKTHIENYLKETDLNYWFKEKCEYFATVLLLYGKLQHCEVYINLYTHSYNVCGVVPLVADESCRSAVAEYLHRINQDIIEGDFELDYRDGEIRVKTYVDCGDECDHLPTEPVLRRSIDNVAGLIDKYTDGLLSVMFGFMTPEEAYQKMKQPVLDNTDGGDVTEDKTVCVTDKSQQSE